MLQIIEKMAFFRRIKCLGSAEDGEYQNADRHYRDQKYNEKSKFECMPFRFCAHEKPLFCMFSPRFLPRGGINFYADYYIRQALPIHPKKSKKQKTHGAGSFA